MVFTHHSLIIFDTSVPFCYLPVPRLDLYGNLVDTVHQETMQRQVSSSAAHLVAAHALGATLTVSCIRNSLEIYDFVTQNFKRSWKSPSYVCLDCLG